MCDKKRYRAAVITLSDRAFRGEREDLSGPLAKKIMAEEGFDVVYSAVLPDEQPLLEGELRNIADNGIADIVITTGGTGFSERDISPEAAAAVASRFAPGISEAIRFNGMKTTKRAMLSRAVSVIRKKTLIVNLPGSPAAVKESLDFAVPAISHALSVITGACADCGDE